MATTRLVSSTVTVGVPDTTIDEITKAATLVGAPADARIATGAGGGMYDPASGTTDVSYPYSVTFTWSKQA